MRRIVLGLLMALSGLVPAIVRGDAYYRGLWQTRIGNGSDKSGAYAYTSPVVHTDVTSVGPAMAHVNATESNYSTVGYTDSVTGKSYYYTYRYCTFIYDGLMYFDSDLTYRFGQSYDDGIMIEIDGVEFFKISGKDYTASGLYTPEASGWVPVKIGVSDYSGGKGPRNKSGYAAWWTDVGICYRTDSATQYNQNTSGWMKLADPGDGSLFRAPASEGDFLSIDTVAPAEGGYELTITAKSPCSVTVHGNASKGVGVAEKSDTWSYHSETASFTDGNLTRTLFVPWTEGALYYTIQAEGVNGIGAFVVWTDERTTDAVPDVSIVLKGVTADSATFDVTLAYPTLPDGAATPTVAVRAAFASGTPEGEPSGWAATQAFGRLEAGTHELTVTDLTPDLVYSVSFAGGPSGDEAWSEIVRASTGRISVTGPEKVYEGDARAQAFTVSRPAGTSIAAVTVVLVWSGATEALIAPLPESVTLGEGVDSASVEFAVLDNDTTDAARSVTLTAQAGVFAPLGETPAATVAVIDDESLVPVTCVWTGAAGDHQWETKENWRDGQVPAPCDEALFTDVGIGVDEEISITTLVGVRTLTVETLKPITFTAIGGGLALSELVRPDLDGDEGALVFGVPVTLSGNAESNVVLDVGGACDVRVNAGLSLSDVVKVEKKGSGSVTLNGPDAPAFVRWSILEGSVNLPVASTLQGTISVGGGETAAALNATVKNAIAVSSTTVTVQTNGTFTCVGTDNNRIKTLDVYEGGLADLSGDINLTDRTLVLRGGRVDGGAFQSSKYIRSEASPLTTVFDSTWSFEAYYRYDIRVDRGESPVDLLISGIIKGGTTQNDRYIELRSSSDKTSAGVIKLLNDLPDWNNRVILNSGVTVYVDNPTKNGLGKMYTTVQAGSTLGGTGVVGRTTYDATNKSVMMSSGSATSRATLAPGTIDTLTGEHLFGTFTIGTAVDPAVDPTAKRDCKMGDWSQVRVSIGNGKADYDALKVTGTLTIGDNCLLKVDSLVDSSLRKAGGRRVIVSADVIDGEFDMIEVADNRWTVSRVGNTYVVDLPPPGFTLFIR